MVHAVVPLVRELVVPFTSDAPTPPLPRRLAEEWVEASVRGVSLSTLLSFRGKGNETCSTTGPQFTMDDGPHDTSTLNNPLLLRRISLREYVLYVCLDFIRHGGSS